MAKRKKRGDSQNWIPLQDVMAERIADLHAKEQEAERERARDRLPFVEGQEIPLGSLRRMVQEIEKEQELGRRFSDMATRRELLIHHAPGCGDLYQYIEAELGPPVTSAKIDEIIRRLCKLLGKRAEQVRAITPCEAVVKLTEPQPAAVQPIICSQTDIRKFLRLANRTGLLQILKDRGILTYEEISPKKFRVWFTDPDQHRQARTEIDRT